MLRKLKIGPRLLLLIAAQTLVVVVIGATALMGFDATSRAAGQLDRSVAEQVRLDQLIEVVRFDFLDVLRQVQARRLSWEAGASSLVSARRRFEDQWQARPAPVGRGGQSMAYGPLSDRVLAVGSAFDRVEEIFQARDEAGLARFLADGAREQVMPLVGALRQAANERKREAQRIVESSLLRDRRFFFASTVIFVLGLALTGVLGYRIYQSISRPVGRISSAVHQVAAGEYDVRTDVSGRDELGELGLALDSLLQEKVSSLVRSEQENERLNDSVLRLLDGVSRLGERDLTVTVPVTPDVTGPVADAINQMAEETGRVLNQVSRIADQVGVASAKVSKKASAVHSAAGAQQREVETTAAELAAASATLDGIAELARKCDQIAGGATRTTNSAMEAVDGMVDAMVEMREAIQETGKRLKRLGERSQEITAVVDIINTIAERTHMLAVNASMQAAAAGESGRGFGVVADEVQRLSENSREATAQIARLVKNIQVDTNDTIATMERTINRVVQGTQSAGSVGEQMVSTREATAQLVDAVKEIAASSQTQARIGADLRGRADKIVARSHAAAQEIGEQLEETGKLVKYAKLLLQSVRAFKLPPREAA